jgi:lipopolysaccharide transport system permease protein
MPTAQAPARTSGEVEISASRGWSGVDFHELWDYREVLYILVWRDLKVRYRQTVLGVLWVMGQPLLTMLIFTLVFNRIARIDAGGIPYTAFVLSGLLPWGFVSSSIQTAANSLVGSASLISKVYFPRLHIPAAAVANNLVDFLVSGVVLAGLLAWYGIVPPLAVLLLPLMLVLAAALSFGIGLWCAALNVRYRDVRVMIPFVLQIWMFATPVVYPSKLLPASLQQVALFNPMLGVIEGFRWCLFGGPAPLASIAVSLGYTLLFLISGLAFFRREERSFVDLL